MLKISLDEAYVFDLLSIYEVKIEKSNTEDKKANSKYSYDFLSKEITDQIGSELFNRIIKSEEYKDLKNVNKKVFELVDKSKESELAKETADANYERYVKKNILQSIFFQNPLTEIKI